MNHLEQIMQNMRDGITPHNVWVDVADAIGIDAIIKNTEGCISLEHVEGLTGQFLSKYHVGNEHWEVHSFGDEAEIRYQLLGEE